MPRGKWGKLFLLAMDQWYTEKGECVFLSPKIRNNTNSLIRVDETNTGLYVPNDYVFRVVEEHPGISDPLQNYQLRWQDNQPRSDIFLPVCSVHPYRKDVVEELERCYKRGARLIKWLPNSQGINPSNRKWMIIHSSHLTLLIPYPSHLRYLL